MGKVHLVSLFGALALAGACAQGTGAGDVLGSGGSSTATAGTGMAGTGTAGMGTGGIPSSTTSGGSDVPMCAVPCDDGNPCTVDTCLVGTCVSTPETDGVSCGPSLQCDGLGACVSTSAIWAKIYGSTGDLTPSGLAVDLMGNVGIAGSYAGMPSFGGSPFPPPSQHDAYVTVLNAAGNFAWDRGVVSNEQSAANDVRFDRFGYAIVSGGFSGIANFGGGALTSPSSPAMFVTKYAPDGTYVWGKSFGKAGGIGTAYQTASDPMGNVLVAGSYTVGVVDFGCGPLQPAGDFDALVAKLDPMGSCVWSKRFGDAGFQQASAVAVDDAGSVVITGILGGTADFGGGPLTSAGGQDVFVAKFDKTGEHLWSKRFGDAQDQIAGGIAVGPKGDIVVVGWFKGTLDFGGKKLTSVGGFDGFVVQLDAAGNHVWSRRFGASQDDMATAVAADGSGNVAITGALRGTDDLGGGLLTSAGGADIVVAKYDATGNHLWSRVYGDALDQSGNGVGFDLAGHLYLAATVNGSVDLGLGPLTSPGAAAVLVAELPR